MKNPTLLDLQYYSTCTGTEITLRDMFAAFALVVASEDCTPTTPLAARAYEIADAMLAEREKVEK